MPFDMNAFLASTVSAEGDTVRKNIAIGEYTAMIDGTDDITKWLETVVAQRGANAGATFIKAEIPWVIDNPALATQLGRARLIVRQEFFLDFLDDGVTLDMSPNRNIELNAVRAAVGQNRKDLAWRFGMLPNAGPALIKVKHEKNADGSRTYERVASVAPIKRA